MRKLRALALAVGLAAGVAVTPVAYAGAQYDQITGDGSSWASNAIAVWVADVANATNNNEQVVFTANGSALGRKDFASAATDFAVSDIQYGLATAPGQPADSNLGRDYAMLPIAAGGTAFPYNVQVGGKQVKNLRLSGDTIAKIFTNQITNWDDPAITKDNNGHALPSIPIITIVHQEGAGVSYQFTNWLATQYPAYWKQCNDGDGTPTEFFPVNCNKGTNNTHLSRSGSDVVMQALKTANGAIATEEYSYPLLEGYPSIKVLNKAGYYTLPTQYNVAVALTKATIHCVTDTCSAAQKADPAYYLTQVLNDVYTNPDPRTYPLSSYVYAIIPTGSSDSRMTTPKRQNLADFLYYSICQGQSEIGPIGYSSLPVNLVQAGFGQIGKLKSADSGVDLTQRDVSTCNNPTFVKGHPSENYLAKIAPQPSACDATGAGPCADGVGTYNQNPGTTKTTGTASTKGSTGTKTGTGTSGSAGTGTAAGTGSISGGKTGRAVTAPVAAGASTAQAGVDGALAPAAADVQISPTTLPADGGTGLTTALTVAAVLLFLAVLLTPVIGSHLAGRRRG